MVSGEIMSRISGCRDYAVLSQIEIAHSVLRLEG